MVRYLTINLGYKSSELFTGDMPMSRHQKMIFNGKKHIYIRSRTKLYGYHLTPVDKKPGVIAVEKNLKGRIELDTNIHEMLHACGEFAGEEWINQTASEIAAALWQLGYRKHEVSKKQKKVRKQSNL